MARSEQAGACCLVKRSVHGRLAGMTDFRGAKSDSDYIVHQDGPINAEPKPEQLANQWKTPASLGYMRNHGEILHLDKASYRLKIEVEDVLKTLLLRDTAYADITSIGLEEIIEKCGRVELAAALQCAGNRRDELDAREEVEGIKWSSGSVLNAKWSGILLRDFLLRLGIPESFTDEKTALKDAHVHFISYQSCEQADRYEASIPLADAMDVPRCVMLADTMNGELLPDEHGGPLRVIVPGFIGARSVKWLQELRISSKPSTNFYMTSDYKKLSPDVGVDEKEEAMKEVPPMQETGLQSSITKVEQTGFDIVVQGYALDGSGAPIASVEVCLVEDATGETPQEDLVKVSLSTGTWHKASLEQEDKANSAKVWSWTLFEARIPVKEEWKGAQLAALCRATAKDGREQESLTEWNIRGVANQGYGIYRNIQCE